MLGYVASVSVTTVRRFSLVVAIMENYDFPRHEVFRGLRIALQMFLRFGATSSILDLNAVQQI